MYIVESALRGSDQLLFMLLYPQTITELGLPIYMAKGAHMKEFRNQSVHKKKKNIKRHGIIDSIDYIKVKVN